VYKRQPTDSKGSTTYADWLLTFFRQWQAMPEPPFRVRRFDQIIDIALGLRPPLSRADSNLNEILVVETSGDLEPMDVLKVCQPGLTKTCMNVRSHSLDDAAGHPLVAAYMRSFADPCDTCARCPVLTFCGGGYFPHRYARATGFSNPSVYCADLKALIKDVQGWTVSQLPQEIVARHGLCPVE